MLKSKLMQGLCLPHPRLQKPSVVVEVQPLQGETSSMVMVVLSEAGQGPTLKELLLSPSGFLPLSLPIKSLGKV